MKKYLNSKGQTTTEYILLLLVLITFLRVFLSLMNKDETLKNMGDKLKSQYQRIYKYGDVNTVSPEDPWAKGESARLHPLLNGRLFGPDPGESN